MKRCTVSVIDGDGEPHQVAVNADSLFAALDQAIEQWSRLWWFNAGAVAEVQVGNRRLRVWLRRVISWCVERACGFSEAKASDCSKFVCAVDLLGFSWAFCLHPPLI